MNSATKKIVFLMGAFVGMIFLVQFSHAAFAQVNEQSVPLQQVTHVHVIKKTATTVRLQWKSVANADRYQIRVKQNGVVIKKVTAYAHHKAIKNLTPDTAYTFQVRATFGTQVGAYSLAKKAHTKIIIAGDTGTLFGFWGLNGYISADGLADVEHRFASTVFQVASASPHYTVATLLPMVRAAGMHVSLRMTTGHEAYTTNGNFDLDKWKAQIDTWKNSGVQEFIDDGTLVAHMLLDDIDTFVGTNPTAAELDEMAHYSKTVLPHLMTFVRESATRMPMPDNAQHVYMHLDTVDNQYLASKGDATVYAQTQYAAARALGVAVINGLNIADGGDGSSSQPGWRAGKYAMSADEITTYGNALLSVPHVQMLLLWEYDGEEQWSDDTIGADYFNQADAQTALLGLGEQAAGYAQTADAAGTSGVRYMAAGQTHPFAGRQFYVDPDSAAAVQIAEWGTRYPKKRALLRKIADQPTAHWFGDWNAHIRHDVAVLAAAADVANQTPVMVLYNIPLRDCGSYSSGGAESADAYKTFVRRFANGIGGANAMVIVEPDALALTDCLSQEQAAERFGLITYAVKHFARLSHTAVYIDAGHSGWIPPSTMTERLQQSGVEYADGFAVNVANFYTTKQSVRYGEKISRLTNDAHFVIDTSRNGQGSTVDHQWCNPPGMGLGHTPTTTPKNSLVDALLWVKPPGESDGTCNGGPAAGQWWLEYALGLARLGQ